ncbi:MAG: OsmC family protein [Vicinamibacterales bacterium]
MSDVKPPLSLELVWEHDLVFAGTSGDVQLHLDSDGVAGPSPMQALAFGLAGCMAMDVVHILKKGRHDVRGLRADLRGSRAEEQPRRFTAFDLNYTVTGSMAADVVERAIELSREKYCSVWHSLRQDITFTITHKVATGV